jgi:hypothetical protein
MIKITVLTLFKFCSLLSHQQNLVNHVQVNEILISICYNINNKRICDEGM